MKHHIVLFFVFLFAHSLLAQANTALEAHPRLEIDRYDWTARHNRIVQKNKTLQPQIILFGDSITHFWGSETDGAACRGQASWDALFGNYRVLNAGFGWDRIQNVRWRFRNGEVTGSTPTLVILHIGTNNWSNTKNARQNTPSETAEGIYDLVQEMEQHWPNTQFIVFDIFPRAHKTSPVRQWINATNAELKLKTWSPRVKRLSAEAIFTEPDGTLKTTFFVDGVHPSTAGYNALATFLKPHIDAIMLPKE